ncbi:MAG: cupin domain-containing protein, partial [Pyrinomonadaceae bacterium]
MNIYLAFASLATLVCLDAAVCAQIQPKNETGPIIKVLSTFDVVEKIDGEAARSTTVEVTLAPGASSAPHRHPGAVFGYVLEGEFEFKVEGKPARTLKAGETFYEPTMILHEIGRNPSNESKTRVLAVVVHPQSARQLVIPE